MKTTKFMLRSIILGGMFFLIQSSFAQIYTGQEANDLVSGAELVKMRAPSHIPEFVRFRKGQEKIMPNIGQWLEETFAMESNFSLSLVRAEGDKLGYTHHRYKQLYNNIPIEHTSYIVHKKDGKVPSVNGIIYHSLDLNTTVMMTESQSLNLALMHVNAETYMWENKSQENRLKMETNNANATYYPKGSLVYISPDPNGIDFQLAYKFDIYASAPLYRAYVYVNASNGNILYESNRIHHADIAGTAVTAYSGNQTIIADFTGSNYRLRETGRGNGIETYNMQEGTDYGAAVDFTDGDNFWNNVNANQDEVATDAHWGAEMSYDYLLNEHGWNSIDNNGFLLRSYVHYGSNYNNAFWDGQRMTYGDGSGSYNPFCALDIAGHEIAHGLMDYTANLVYSYESGALNESFSDIWGTAVEFYGKFSQANWQIGEDIGVTLRDMSDPKAYGDPDTYLGTNWATGPGDNGGVHTNSGVQNFWFYLLTVGGTGTNDNGDSYNIPALGLSVAGAIAFRNLSVYLSSNSQYSDARFYAIQSAIDIYGACSPEAVATTDAWYAVGVGLPFDSTVIADFSANPTTSCQAPFTVSFTNLSSNGGFFYWDFGDGNTDSTTNPTHVYNTYGTFTVSLIADGNPCGIDSTTKVNYIVVDSTLPCIVIMPVSGSGDEQFSCTGTVYDNGGPTGTYADNTDNQITISPTGASSVTLTINVFDIEPGSGGSPPCDYDYVEFFDGPTTAYPSLGRYCNTTGSPGTVTSTSGSITIFHHADPAVNGDGFDIDWVCTMPSTPPTANFSVSDTSTCTGAVVFTDLSTNGPTSWSWDFGDGGTSTQQSPGYSYINSGTYTVTLIATNSFGSDTAVQTNLVTVTKPTAPTTTSADRCGPGSVTLTASGSGNLNWYDDSIGTNLLNTGTSYTTPSLAATTNYYVEDEIVPASQYVGPVDNTYGTGGNHTNTNYYLIFDAFSEFTLVSVKVYAQGMGYRTVELRNSSGVVLQDTNINIADGESRIILDFDVNPGTGYQLATSGMSDMYRNNSNTSFPYTLPGVLSITGNNIPDPDYYYYYYDWEVRDPICTSEPAVVTATINEVPTASISSSTNTTCNGDCDGTATATQSGGTGPFTYSWSNAETTASISGLCANTYIVTVTDANTCANDTSVTITEPAAISISMSSIDASCGNSDGQATASPTNGVGTYTFLWDDPGTQTSATATGLSGGTYNVVVTDANSCTANSSVVVSNTVPIVDILSSTNITCNGGNDGQAVSSANSGVPPYTYLWNDPSAQSDSVATGLSAGSFTVTATDASGCLSTNSVTLTEPAAIIINFTTTDASCVGICDGSSSVAITNGVSPFTYAWDDPSAQSTSTPTALCAGTFTVMVADADGCSSSATTTVANGPGITVGTTGLTNTSCGACTGDATVEGSDGLAPYSYSWNDPGSQSTAMATGLCAGNFGVTVTDNIGCANNTNVDIFDLGGVFSSISSSVNILCNGDSDGSATVAGSGGGAPYTYQWDDPGSQTNDTATGLAAGTYNVTVSDTNSCISVSSITLSEPSALSNTISSVAASCGNSDGSATVIVSGGAGTYTYLWDDPGAQTNATANGLSSGTYNVVVTDANSCTANSSVVVNNTVPIVVILSSTNITCNGGNDGQAVSSANSGVPPYTYLWNDPSAQSDSVATGLSAGSYTVTATDASGCLSTNSITLTEPAAIIINFTTSDASCMGVCNGSSSVSITNGVSPFTYAWDDPLAQSTSTPNGLCAGTFNVVVTDADACASNANTVVANGPGITVNTTGLTNTSCGVCTGDATVAGSGGTAPYNYSWNDPAMQSTAMATGLCAGNFVVNVTDSVGCVDSTNVSISDLGGVSSSISFTVNISCNGNSDGSATVAGSGGGAPYTYQWDDPGSQTTTTATGLAAGTYNVTVSDTNSCISVSSVTLSEPSALSNTISSVAASCGNSDGSATVIVSGGTIPYTYLWNDPAAQTNATADSLATGTYQVVMTDANNCTDSTSATVSNIGGPSVSAVSSNVKCNGGADGQVFLSVSGGTAPYNYLWDDPGVQTTAIATGLIAGTYNVSVTDSSGCMATSSVTISEPTALSNSTTSTNANCGAADGTATVVVSGGTPPYNYLWDDPGTQTNSTAIGLLAGGYQVLITDSNACTSSDSATIGSIGGLIVSITSTDVSCNGGNNGIAASSVSGGGAPFTYQWDDPDTQNTSIAVGLIAGTYNLTVTDGSGCIGTQTTTITEPAPLTATTTVNDALPGTCTGNAVVTASGGTPPYAYLWSNGETTTSIISLCPNTYTVTVTDTNSCTVMATATVGTQSIIQEVGTSLSINVYPNPTTGKFVVEFTLVEKQDITIQLFSATGQLVVEEQLKDLSGTHQHNFDLREYPKGVYLLQLFDEKGVTNKKVIIE